MKKLVITTIALLALVQTPVKAKSAVYDMTVQGVKVIVEPTKANQIIAVNVGFRGGYGYGETSNPAIPQVTAPVTTESGTQTYPKDVYREALSRLVTSIAASADAYRTTYSLTCVRPKLNESWKIFEDVIKHPLYDDEEFTKTKMQFLSAISSRRQEPEDWANFMLDSIWGAGHRATRITQAADVNGLSIDQLRSYHNAQLERSRMLIVIVGDVTKAEVEQKVKELLAGIPEGNFKVQPFERIPGPGVSDLTSEQRALPTTYVVGRFIAPQRKDADFWSMRLAATILSDRLYEQVRTKRNLSYSPYSFVGGAMGNYYGQVGVSSTLPDSAMHVILRELNRIRTEGVTAKELRDIKEGAITQIYMSQQSNLAQATRFYNMEMEVGDYHAAENLMSDLLKVTDQDIRNAVAKYLHQIYWVAVGDQSKLTKSDVVFP